MRPKTKLPTSEEQASAFRLAVQQTYKINPPYGYLERICIKDAPEVLTLFLDERASGDVYTLPRSFSLESVTAYIEDHHLQANMGEGLLMCSRDENGQIISLVDFQFWPKLAACEFGGVIAFDHQSKSVGTQGIIQLCNWVFDVVGIRLLAMTTSLENIRSQKMLLRLGFTQMGEVDSVNPNGMIRRSLYWELRK